MTFETDLLVQSLVTRINQAGVIGIALVGSYARGEHEPHSDVDLNLFVEPPHSASYELQIISGRLVSFKHVLLQREIDSLRRPEAAIGSVPGLRQMQILLDDAGQLAKLQQAARDLEWSALQAAADEYAVNALAGCAEEVRKILDGLMQGDESKVLYAGWGLFKDLTDAVAVQRGLMIGPENRYFDILQDSLGPVHPWTRALRLAFGMDPGDAHVPVFRTRGRAALDLYAQTAVLFKDILTDACREVILDTLQLIQHA